MEKLKDIVLEFIDTIRNEDVEEDYCPAIEFINRQYAIDKNLCIEMIKQGFLFDDYRYADSVISAVICSDIDCFSSWFKDLLLKKKTEYSKDLYDLYKEVFDKIEL